MFHLMLPGSQRPDSICVVARILATRSPVSVLELDCPGEPNFSVLPHLETGDNDGPCPEGWCADKRRQLVASVQC